MRRADRGKGSDQQNDSDSTTSSTTADRKVPAPGVFGPRTDHALDRLFGASERRSQPTVPSDSHTTGRAGRTDTTYTSSDASRPSRPILVRPKLWTTTAGDRFEREADRFAAAAVARRFGGGSGRKAAAESPATTATGPTVTDDTIQSLDGTTTGESTATADAPVLDGETTLPRQAGEGRTTPAQTADSRGSPVPAGVGRWIESRRGGGRSLAPATRQFFESAFGADFAGVRVHADPESARAASALGARAFTHGENVFFASGEYRPESRRGTELLAHELAHVRQQGRGSTPSLVQREETTGAEGSASETTEQAGPPGARKIGLPWQGTVLQTFLNHFVRVFPTRERRVVAAVQWLLTRMEGGYQVTTVTDAGEKITYRNLRRTRAERLAREQEIETYILDSQAATALFRAIGVTWQEYEREMNQQGPSDAEADDATSQATGMAGTTTESDDGEREPPTVEFHPDATEEDQELVQRFFADAFAEATERPATAEGRLYISAADIEAIRTLYEESEADREAILDELRGAERRKASRRRPTLDELVESARAAIRLERARELFGEPEPDEDAEPLQDPIVPRPVEGDIVGPSGTITTGMEVTYKFETTNRVDALRVPHVAIRWLALRRRDDGSTERIESDSGRYIDTERSGGLDFRPLEDRTFEPTFPKPGTYEIHAIVHHNFYRPDAFVLRPIVVVPRTQVIDELVAKEDEGLVDVGQRSDDPNYDFESLSDLGDYDEGYRYTGRLTEEGFARGTGSFEDSYRGIDEDIARLDDLLDHYRTAQEESDQDNSTLIEWIEERRQRLVDTRRQLEGFEQGEDSQPVFVRGRFASQTAGVPHKNLELVAWFDYQQTSDGEERYSGHLLDHTGLVGPENLHFTATASGYETMIEELFVELSADYPNGFVSVTFQQYDGETAKRDVVTFERGSQTLGGEITDVVFSEAASLIVNVGATILTVFPPTTGIGIGIGLAYNGLATAHSIAEAAESDTLRASHAVDVGLLFLEALPALKLGRTARSLAAGVETVDDVLVAGRTYRAISASGHIAEYAGEFYLFTDAALQQIQQIHNQQITQLAEIRHRIEMLQRQDAPQRVVDVELERAARLQSEIRNSVTETFARLAATEAVMAGTPALVRRGAEAHTRMRERVEGTGEGMEGDSGVGETAETTPERDRPVDPARERQGAPERERPRERERETVADEPVRREESERSERQERPERSERPEQSQESTGDLPAEQRREPEAASGRSESAEAADLPSSVALGGRVVQIRRSAELDGREVRVSYDPDHRGLVTRIWIEAGPNAGRREVAQHLRTARLMQRYQGLSGRIRIYLTRIQNLFAEYTRVVGRAPQPGSRAFEAKLEIEKLPRIIHERAQELVDPELSVVERANLMAELDQLQSDYQHYVDVLERMDAELGAGYVAARDEPRSNQAALDAGYPPLEEAPGHYYVRSATGGFHLRRFVGSDDPPKQVVWREGEGWVVTDRTGDSVVYDPPETLRPGEMREYTGPRGTTATATRRPDGTIVVESTVGPGRGRLGYERAMFRGVEVGLPGWERAHSQGQGTGHESPFGILYAPAEVNQAYQNRGIEQHIRDLFGQIDDDVTLHLTTETAAHPDSRRLASIVYKIEALRGDGDRVPLYEVEITVSDDRRDPRVEISAERRGDAEEFMRDAPGREAGTSQPETPRRDVDPVERADLPREAADTVERLDAVRDRISDHPELSAYDELLADARRDLFENPGPETIRNARETLAAIERQLGE